MWTLLKSYNLLKIDPNNLSFFWEARRISWLSDVFRRFEKKLQLVRIAEKNRKDHVFNFFL